MSSYGAIQLVPSSANTYTVCEFFTPSGTTPTDIWTIYGSSSKTIKILYIGLLFNAGSNLSKHWYLIKRSTANTGGTSASQTPVKMDSNNPSATATVTQYTANPTLGTSVGTISISGLTAFPPNVANNYVQQSTPSQCIFNATLHNNGQPLVLRGTGEGVALNLNGLVGGLSSGTCAVYCVWVEE